MSSAITPEKLLSTLTVYEKMIADFTKKRVKVTPLVVNPLESKGRDLVQSLGHALHVINLIRTVIEDKIFAPERDMPDCLRLVGVIEALLWVNGLASTSSLKKIRS